MVKSNYLVQLYGSIKRVCKKTLEYAFSVKQVNPLASKDGMDLTSYSGNGQRFFFQLSWNFSFVFPQDQLSTVFSIRNLACKQNISRHGSIIGSNESTETLRFCITTEKRFPAWYEFACRSVFDNRSENCVLSTVQIFEKWVEAKALALVYGKTHGEHPKAATSMNTYLLGVSKDYIIEVTEEQRVTKKRFLKKLIEME